MKFVGVIYTLNVNNKWVGEEACKFLTVRRGIHGSTNCTANWKTWLARSPERGPTARRLTALQRQRRRSLESLTDEKKALSFQSEVVDDRTNLWKTSRNKTAGLANMLLFRFLCVDTAGNLFACAVAYTVMPEHAAIPKDSADMDGVYSF